MTFADAGFYRPIVLGCDASGTVVEVGEGVSKFKVGDAIFGCTRLGVKGYGTFQEFVGDSDVSKACVANHIISSTSWTRKSRSKSLRILQLSKQLHWEWGLWQVDPNLLIPLYHCSYYCTFSFMV
jgi:hypothetical protein